MDVKDEKTEPAFVVGLGASAGGLEALEQFFDGAIADSGGAYVVVMHLARDFRSVLDELLSRRTAMAVHQIDDGDVLQPNTVYVIRPGTEVEVVGSVFRVSARPAATVSGRVSSVDILLQSLAKSWREKAAAVILSGSGSDGAHGVMAVHASGGIVLAQSPETAKFDSMPIAAIATNCVTVVEAPDVIAKTISEVIFLPRKLSTNLKSSSDDAAMQSILASVVGSSHLDAAQYTQSTFDRRVQRRMRETQVGSLEKYASLVKNNLNEARHLSETLLIGVTDFFRDESAFLALGRHVAPDLIRRATSERRAIRIWVPGCASGEEAYSLAMLFAEASADFPTPVEIQIFATDVHKSLLAEAARGEYSSERMTSVSEERRRAFFTRSVSGGWVVDSKIRKSIVFAPHDVLIDPPFTRLDMVSCRNLLIYFSVEAQQRVIGAFAFGLHEKGYLFLGSSETIGGQRDSFEFVDVRRRIFRRTRESSRAPSYSRAIEPFERLSVLSPQTNTVRRSQKSRETLLQPAYSALLKEYAPPCLLVSAERDLLHTFGDARRFLRAPEGVVRLDIVDMCDSALRAPLATGIDHVIRLKKSITFSRIEIASIPEKGMVVNVRIDPLTTDGEINFALVIIEVHNHLAAGNISKLELDAESAGSDRLVELELEIMRTREALQSTIEEIETANEELQATNEELMSSNEELQSTNEELSSLNEELHSVNAEHFRQNDELLRLTRDFDALLHATEVGVLFFDGEMNIRRFTRLVAELFKFTETDIGRALRTFRSPFQGVDLERFLQKAMENGTIEETDTHDDMNRLWLLRAVGYPDQKGVVLSVIGISRLRAELSDGIDYRKRLLELAEPFAGDPLIVANPFTATVEFANRSAWRILGIPEVIEGSYSLSRLTPEWGDTTWLSWLSTMAPGSVNRRLDVSLLDKNGKLIIADLLTTVIQDDSTNHVIIRMIENRDRVIALNEMKERARAIAASNRELEQFASIVAHDLRAPLRHLNQFSQFLIAELDDAASPNVREYLNIIQSSSVNMSGMIERLLDYARLGTGEPVFAPVSLEDSVHQASELLHGELLEAGATLEVGKLSWVRGDRMLLIRLVQNLIMNATKYRRRDRPLKIVVSTVVNDNTVTLSIADNGIGIEEVHSQTIFKMFSRLQPDSEYTGFGMGLAICRRICEIHGGTISLDTSYDEGAKFDVVFKYAAGKDH